MADDPRTHQATLGCGSLILIAVIVMVFSGRSGTSDLSREVSELRSEIRDLRTMVQTQSDQLKILSTKLDKVPAKE